MIILDRKKQNHKENKAPKDNIIGFAIKPNVDAQKYAKRCGIETG